MSLNLAPQMFGQPVLCPGCQNTSTFQATKPVQPPAPVAGQGGNEAYPPEAFSQQPANTQQPYQQPPPYQQQPYPAPQPGFGQPPARKSGNPLPWILGCLGGGCLLIVIIGILIGMLLPAVQAVREAARKAQREQVATAGQNLLEARQGKTTNLTRKSREGNRPPKPPADLFNTVKYDSDVGKLAAYVGVDPGDGKKHPAIIWLFGGFGNGIGETAWERQSADNDQSASAYREAGIVMMYPALRGGNDNPGHFECMWGEINDVLAAADYLASLPYVDPDRIYLGGHSTGGTLALLCTASTDRFRATIALGPVDDVSGYGQEVLPFNAFDINELKYRNPGNWLSSIQTKTLIIEGARGNSSSVNALDRSKLGNDNIECHIVTGKDHFNVISGVNKVMAKKIKSDTGTRCNIELND